MDGFNLYYGAVRGTQWKWLDLQTYFERLRQDDDIVEIAYFTAMRVDDESARQRHETYLRALESRPKVRIIHGKYRPKTVRCSIDCAHDEAELQPGACSACGHSRGRWFGTAEEKQTDVAIGVRMLDDAYRNRCDRLVVVSGDGDIVPAMKMVKERFPSKTLHVYIPARDPRRAAAKDVRDAADKHLTLPLELIERCQFPDALVLPSGVVSRPDEWQ